MVKRFLLSFSLLLSFIIFSSFVYADLGPKPSADIYLTLNGQPIPNEKFNAKMMTCHYLMEYESIIKELEPYEMDWEWYDKCQEITDRDTCDKLQSQKGMTNLSLQSHWAQCEDENCVKLMQLIPDEEKGCYWAVAPMAWGGECENAHCRFSYALPSKFKLAVYLPSEEEVYLSQEISRENFRSTFEADLISGGNINIVETTPFLKGDFVRNLIPFGFALFITLILELFVAYIFLLIIRFSKQVLIHVLIANVITLPIVWFVFPLLKIEFFMILILAEIFALAFEAYFLYWRNKGKLPLGKSFLLSILMNLASLFVGWFIYLLDGLFLQFLY